MTCQFESVSVSGVEVSHSRLFKCSVHYRPFIQPYSSVPPPTHFPTRPRLVLEEASPGNWLGSSAVYGRPPCVHSCTIPHLWSGAVAQMEIASAVLSVSRVVLHSMLHSGHQLVALHTVKWIVVSRCRV